MTTMTKVEKREPVGLDEKLLNKVSLIRDVLFDTENVCNISCLAICLAILCTYKLHVLLLCNYTPCRMDKYINISITAEML